MIEEDKSKKIQIKQWTVLNDSKDNHAMHVSYVDLADENDGSYMTHHALAAHVTAHARLRLHDEMVKVGDNLLGHDTDSLWYVVKPGGYEIPEGSQLGEWEPEEIFTGKYMITGVQGTGPKSYSMRIAIKMDEQDLADAMRQTEIKLVDKIQAMCDIVSEDSRISSNTFHTRLCAIVEKHPSGSGVTVIPGAAAAVTDDEDSALLGESPVTPPPGWAGRECG